MVGQSILRNSDEAADQSGADGLLTNYRVVDGHQQRQIDDVEAGEIEGKQGLQSQSQHRNQQVNEQRI